MPADNSILWVLTGYGLILGFVTPENQIYTGQTVAWGNVRGYQGYWNNMVNTAYGYFVNGPKNMVLGIINANLHPIDTIINLANTIAHPIDSFNAAVQAIIIKAQTNEGIGEIAFNVAITVTPAALAARDALLARGAGTVIPEGQGGICFVAGTPVLTTDGEEEVAVASAASSEDGASLKGILVGACLVAGLGGLYVNDRR